MKAARILQILLGLILIWYVGNGFVRLMFPQFHIPVEMLSRDTAGYEFVTATQDTGYLYWLIKGLTVLVGGMLVLNLFSALALAMYTPIAINHILFSVFLNPQGLVISLIIFALLIVLIFQYRNYYKPLFAIR